MKFIEFFRANKDLLVSFVANQQFADLQDREKKDLDVYQTDDVFVEKIGKINNKLFEYAQKHESLLQTTMQEDAYELRPLHELNFYKIIYEGEENLFDLSEWKRTIINAYDFGSAFVYYDENPYVVNYKSTKIDGYFILTCYYEGRSGFLPQDAKDIFDSKHDEGVEKILITQHRILKDNLVHLRETAKQFKLVEVAEEDFIHYVFCKYLLTENLEALSVDEALENIKEIDKFYQNHYLKTKSIIELKMNEENED